MALSAERIQGILSGPDSGQLTRYSARLCSPPAAPSHRTARRGQYSPSDHCQTRVRSPNEASKAITGNNLKCSSHERRHCDTRARKSGSRRSRGAACSPSCSWRRRRRRRQRRWGKHHHAMMRAKFYIVFNFHLNQQTFTEPQGNPHGSINQPPPP